MPTHKIIHGKSEIELKQFEDNSIDSCVTDPPYGLEFMGKSWDKFQNTKTFGGGGASIDSPYARGEGNKTPRFYHIDLHAFQQFTYQWATELYRVLKPGAHILVFGGTRTYHRMACAIEDSGFEVRDMINWVYGSGFPKSLDISKAIDKRAGKEREVIGPNPHQVGRTKSNKGCLGGYAGSSDGGSSTIIGRNSNITVPASEEAIKWNGWGTGLKPAHEPILLARKPISERNIASNVLKWGVGGLNISRCRIKANDKIEIHDNPKLYSFSGNKSFLNYKENIQGRFPANLILSHTEDCEEFYRLKDNIPSEIKKEILEYYGAI